jgi:hypothetical protein
MASPANTKTDRNKHLVQLVDGGMTLREAAAAVKLKSVSTAHKVYWREKIRFSGAIPRDCPRAMRRAFRHLAR